MKRINSWYWIFTVPFLGMMIFSAIPNIVSNEESVKFLHDLMGYPVYIIPFLGVAKLLGSIAILLPMPWMNRWKEWAYAGLLFDLIGATYSFIALGNPISAWAAMLIFIALGIGSYLYHHKRLALKKALSNSLR